MNMAAQLWKIQMPPPGLSGGCAPCAAASSLGQVEPSKLVTPGRVFGAVMLVAGLWGLGRVGAPRGDKEDLILPLLAIVGGTTIALRKPGS